MGKTLHCAGRTGRTGTDCCPCTSPTSKQNGNSGQNTTELCSIYCLGRGGAQACHQIQVQEWGPPPIPHPGPLYLTLKSQRVSFEASHFHLPARNKLIELLTQLQGVIRFKKGLAGASMINYWWKNWLGVCLCPSWIDLFVFFRLEQLLVPIVFLQPDGSILFSSFKINSGFIYVLGKKDFFFFFTSVMES